MSSEDHTPNTFEGWTLLFHPDLIRQTSLDSKIKDYSFFFYDSYEALHLSTQERRIITTIVANIRDEYTQSIDAFTNELIVSNIELLLNHCKRFYNRQMGTRSNITNDIVHEFDRLLRQYFHSNLPQNNGLPQLNTVLKPLDILLIT